MTATEVLIIQKLDSLRRASLREGECKSLWANGRGYISEKDAYTTARRATDTAYAELIGLMVAPS